MHGPAAPAVVSLRQLAADVAAALLFSSRLPIPGASAISGADIARAGWALPVAGAIVGLIAAAVYWLAWLAGLAPSVARAQGAPAVLSDTKLTVTGYFRSPSFLAATRKGFFAKERLDVEFHLVRLAPGPTVEASGM